MAKPRALHTMPRVGAWPMDMALIARTDSTPDHTSGMTATAVYGNGVLDATSPTSISSADRRACAIPGGRTRGVRGEAKGTLLVWDGWVERMRSSDIVSHRDNYAGHRVECRLDRGSRIGQRHQPAGAHRRRNRSSLRGADRGGWRRSRRHRGPVPRAAGTDPHLRMPRRGLRDPRGMGPRAHITGGRIQ